MTQKILVIFFLLLQTISLKSQDSQIKFTRNSIADGLSLSSVYCGIQDSKGFLWFGTEDGLNRYDGKNFTIFRPLANDSNSISNKWIDAIYEDKYKFLWIITKIGVCRYNPIDESFKRYLLNHKLSNNNVFNCIYEDSDSCLWLGAQKGAFFYDRKNDVFIPVSAQLNNLFINCFIQIQKDIILIGTANGLYKYSKSNSKFEEYKINGFIQNVYTLFKDKKGNVWLGSNGYILKLSSDNTFQKYNLKDNSLVETIFEDSKNQFWIITNLGLYRFYPELSEFKKIIDAPETSGSLSINNRKPIYEDKEGNLWFGTYGKGVFQLNSKGEININLVNNPTDLSSISENAVNLIFQDKSGCIWFGTFGAGLNKYDPLSTKFHLIKKNPSDINSLSSNFIWSIFEDNDGELWVGTNADGLNRYNPQTKKYTHYKNIIGNSNSLSNNCVREIFQDKQGFLWFGTNGGGLNKFDKKTQKFIVYKNNINDTNSISGNSVRVVLEDSKGIFWIGTTSGLNKFDPKTEKFTTYINDAKNPNSISSNFIYSTIYENYDGTIWIGTYEKGLSILNPKTGIFSNYFHNDDDTSSIASDIVFSFVKDKFEDDIYWIGTNDGLDKFDYKKSVFKHITMLDGLPNSSIYGILQDKDGNLWLSTNYGISFFNVKTKEFKNFDKNDGLQSNEFNGGAFHEGKSGKFYFAGVYGLNEFYPDSLKFNKITPMVEITNFLIFNSKVKIIKGSNQKNKNNVLKINNEYFISKSITYSDTIILTYREKVISFEFAALHFSNPLKNKYKYRLLNFEQNWNETSNRNYVTYTNIDPGTYVLEVTAANSDGFWNSNITRLTIIIKPPFWETWFFRITSVIVFLFLIYLFYKSRIKRIKKQKDYLEQVVIERTKEIVHKNEILELQKEEIQTQASNLQKANEEIILQKELLEKSHKNITDSIIYAQRIQKAVLPDENEITQILNHHFILFKPRDIVSGDFYFIKKVNNTIIFATADCTGHGVPGAFMSMLGIALLNEIVLKKEIKSSNQVLDELRRQIKSSLQQTGQQGEQQDGMDIAFCSIDIQTNELSFAGAHNPAWIFRKNSQTLSHTDIIILQPNRQPVGVYLKEVPFVENKFQLQKDDIIYIFTDGYHSQFGGQACETMKIERFKQFLKDIINKSLNEQKILLERRFIEWKGNNEQTDDVLVIGVKI